MSGCFRLTSSILFDHSYFNIASTYQPNINSLFSASQTDRYIAVKESLLAHGLEEGIMGNSSRDLMMER